MTAPIYTASWRVLAEASTAGELPVKVVRISRGVPRFWPAAEAFPYVGALAPAGWVFAVAKSDPERAFRGYRAGIHRLGVERVRALLAEAAGDDPRPLCLCCFELHAFDCHRGARGFASVWQRWTGEQVADLSLLRNRTTGVVALVREVEPATTRPEGAQGDLARYAKPATSEQPAAQRTSTALQLQLPATREEPCPA